MNLLNFDLLNFEHFNFDRNFQGLSCFLCFQRFFANFDEFCELWCLLSTFLNVMNCLIFGEFSRILNILLILMLFCELEKILFDLFHDFPMIC